MQPKVVPVNPEKDRDPFGRITRRTSFEVTGDDVIVTIGLQLFGKAVRQSQDLGAKLRKAVRDILDGS